MKFLDLFAGIGGFRLGLEMAGHECVGHIEIDKYANKSYAAMHNPKESEFFGTDIRAVEPSDLPEADIYCGGFPCQSFSVAGKRGGFEDTRGTLFFEVMRLARVRKPEYLFLENVAGLLSHDGGNTFWTILNTIRESGYDVEYQVLNSKNFGVPQNRERVFIIGHLRTAGGSRREVFPVRQNDELSNNQSRSNEGQPQAQYCATALRSTGAMKADGTFIIDRQGNEKQKDYASCLTGGGHSGGNHSDMDLIVELNPRKADGTQTYQQDRIYDGNGIVPALCKDKSDLLIYPVLTPGRPEKRQNGRRFKEDGEDMFTLTGQDRHGVMIIDDTYSEQYGGVKYYNDTIPTLRSERHGLKVSDGFRIRRLTPKECFRLQGYPDEYFERAKAVNSDSQLYKQAGNSVTVNVIYEIAKRLE